MQVDFLNQLFAWASIPAQLAILVVLLVLLMNRKSWLSNDRQIVDIWQKAFNWLSKNSLWLALLTAFGATTSSLFYSNVVGFAPCNLCWWQRIFMYPLVPILAVAVWKKDQKIADYILWLSGIGGVIAAYHSYLQWGGSELFVCDAVINCSQRYVWELGYITIPFMSLVSFALVFVLALAVKLSHSRSS